MIPDESVPENQFSTRKATSELLVMVLQKNRRLQDLLAGSAEALHVAIEIVHDKDDQIERLQDTNAHLRAQLRAYASGRTVAEERRDIEYERYVEGDAA